jgi:hypothetical protein
MARVRTVEFLPEIFQTSTNKQFLAATLDQLVQEPAFTKVQGFVGRRVGPGVNPNDEYIKETTDVRTDYQLEPGVVLKKYNTSDVKDVITYPGITDAIGLSGGLTDNADRLYTSDYYTWDPFIDVDKFSNFSQYYWLPSGPQEVDVFAGQLPMTDTFDVTRENGVYTFSGVAGNNPVIRLVRGGTYNFNVAQNNKETVNYRVTGNGTSSFVIDYKNNPTLTLVRGNTYVFDLTRNEYAFYIKTDPTLGTTNQYNTGVTNNGVSNGIITFTVPQDAPDTLYYCNDIQLNLKGTFNIIDAVPGTGPGFWIQVDPGVDGKLIATPNISGRNVLGVVNNGEDLGTVTFNVPLATAQSFYYTLTNINSSLPTKGVDLISSLKFNQINNIFVDQFLLQNPNGIDGVTNLNGKTLVFLEQQDDAEAGGWEVTTQYDPLIEGVGNNGRIGSYDTTLFDQTTIVDPTQRYSVWQASYATTEGGSKYITLNPVLTVNNLEKFTVLSGTEYSSTEWFKNASGVFEEIPLLTATKTTLYYQDATDPEIFGRIQLVDQDNADVLDVNEIIGKKNYTSPNGVVLTNGLKITFIGNVEPVSYQGNSYYIEGVGTAIKLLPVTNFVTPEMYVQEENILLLESITDSSLDQPLVPDYLTINRASPDLNAWTRSNRWFHIDVINASAEYNNTVPVLDNNGRAKRPIIEFRAGTRLFNFGTEGKQPIDIIDFNATNAFSNINGSVGYNIDGYAFVNGTRVIFAADTDINVRNKIYEVEFVTLEDGTSTVINLIPASDADVKAEQTVVCLSGSTQQGLSFYFDGVNWESAQQKVDNNQPPLFDVYDLSGISFGDRVKYPSTNFVGSKLFSYAIGTGTDDTVLGFPLKYLSLSNVGDIVFENNLYVDTFIYTKDNVSSTEFISAGYVREYSNRVSFVKEIGWQRAADKSVIRQQFSFTYNGDPLVLDVPVDVTSVFPALQLYVGGTFIDPTNYTFAVTNNSTIITIKTLDIGSIIEVNALSPLTSKFGFYQVPVNLENNPLNGNSSTFTLGTIRSHYESIAENLKGLTGKINGANNSRDLGNIIPYGENILQQSSPMTMAGYFMRSQEYNIFSSLEYNSREYEKFKAQLLDTITRNDYTNLTVPEIITAAINNINAGKIETSPFYWSDMLPAKSIYTQSVVSITPISTNVFDLSTTYDFTSSNYKGLLVYVNNRLLTINKDYVVSVDSPQVTITSTLNVGDTVTIQEYPTTYGNFVPNTPTKLGLYPSWEPRIYVDTNYVNPQTLIQGHDGSLTVAFGDFRDEVLLEFETRIFNNLKIKSKIPLTTVDIVPGQFRTTDYTLTEVNNILSTDFLSWIGWNKLNYQSQDYISTNEFTWNYSACGNKLNNEPMPVGAWRGLYQYFYDTTSPNTTPWEMLGFSIEPNWWADVYGAAPYTSDNLVLWDDLAAGKVADPAGAYYLPQYARPRLTEIIPVGSEGELLSPFSSVVGLYDTSQFQKSWSIGDGGPVEYSWTTSSSYPFAVMRLFALTRPAEFFSLFADRDLYKFDTDFNQYLYNGRYRLDANGVQVYGDGTSKASFIDWIVDYNQQTGLHSTENLTKDLESLDVRLCYRVGAFTDKQYLKIYTEKSSPNSLNSSLLLPDESYSLLLYKNQPFERISYSSVILQVVDNGYAIYGYSITSPFFNILVSKTYGIKTTIEAGGESVTVPVQYTDEVVQVPYGYVFTNETVVVDFLLSYGALLTQQGIVFDGRENGYTLDWNQMAKEFLYWANQNWEPGAVINLNPTAFSLTAAKPQLLVDSVVVQTPENSILDQNRTTIPVRNLVVDRNENIFKVTTLNEQTISYLDLKFTNYESIVVLDNVSVFNDLIYEPITGARQSRINVTAIINSDWNGQLDAQGFIFNNSATIEEWQPQKKYAKGEIVIYKNNYWSAQTIVQPKIEFEYKDWVKSDYTKIQKGLLQNLPNLSDQLANSYNTNTANLETDQDLVSFGLIGFRPREYMAALNLDDISQVNVYKQFLRDKGTKRAIQLIGNANTNKETAEYNLYENWAILRGAYGAIANKSFIELRLNEALLLSDPATIQIVNVGQTSQADQQILLGDLWRQSYKIPNTDVFSTTTTPVQDSALPTAGYVNLDDVDITVFSLDARLQLAPGVLDTIGVGTTIWAAKVNSYDWGVYRCTGIPGFVKQISSNLNLTSIVTFSEKHGLSVNDVAIIRNFDSSVDGVYRVLSIPSANEIVVNMPITRTLTGQGVAVVLKTMRVAQASDVVNLSYANELTSGTKAWVDDNGAGLWEVLEKQTPFVQPDNQYIPVDSPAYNSQFGYSVSQGSKNIIAAVGAPGWVDPTTTGYNNSAPYNIGDRVIYQNSPYVCVQAGSGNLPTNTAYWQAGAIGAVYPYLRDNSNQYAENTILTLSTPETVGYGDAVDIGFQSWLVAGASSSNSNMGYATAIFRAEDSNAFEQRQLLIAPDEDFALGEFGYSVSVSNDERWLYVGAPGNNKVYAFAALESELQISRHTTDGITKIYSFSNDIVIDPSSPNQLTVVYNNKLLIQGTDYSVTGTSVVLTALPPAGQSIIIQRKQAQLLDSTTYYDIASTTVGAGVGATFVVTNTHGEYFATVSAAGSGYAVDDIIVISGTLLNGTSPTNDLTMTVESVTTTGGVETVNVVGTSTGVSTDTFDLNLYLYGITDRWQVSVTVNGILQRPLGIDYTFDPSTGELEFTTNPAKGASIVATSKTQFVYVDVLEVDGLLSGDRFGASLSQTSTGRIVVVGATNADSAEEDDSGVSYVFSRGVIKYIVSDDTQTTFELPADFKSPVAVLLNGQYLQNSAQFIDGQYSVTGTEIVLNSSVTLNVGDIIEIENNIFTLVQELSATVPSLGAQFGYALDICPTNCSLYIGAPDDSTIQTSAGSVERYVNQATLYGIITSTNANPILVPGETLSINNFGVTLSTPATWDSLVVYTKDTFVIDSGNIYVAVQNVPIGVLISNVDYWSASSWVELLSTDINQAELPNITSSVTNGLLTIHIINQDAAIEFNKLSVLPGTPTVSGSMFDRLGFEVYAHTQTITSPSPSYNANFGSSLSISSDATTLIVGAPGGNTYEPVTFDDSTTIFDDRSTVFSTIVNESGVVYSFDMLQSANSSLTNPVKFVFGQQIYNTESQPLDKWGASVSYVSGRLLVGVPGSDLGDSSLNYGNVSIFENITNRPAWYPIHVQEPTADVNLINTVYMYNKLQSSKTHYLDFINPLQGKILGAARQNIDFIGSDDPAAYNTGGINNNGNFWAEDKVGKIWWDITTARFIDPSQNDIVYTSRRWGQLFPGSTIAIYQWVESSEPPASYAGPGTPANINSYTIRTKITQQGNFATNYYFWVGGIDTIDISAGKTLSTVGISRYIENPRGSGIPYLAALNANTVAIYNSLEFLSASDTVIHIGYDRERTDDNIHSEYELIAQDNPDSFLSANLYRKLQDSFCGVNSTGALVPDVTLSIAEQYGVQFRPRQSMFANRFAALQNYLGYTNNILKQNPITESRTFILLNSAEPEPTAASGDWDMKLNNIQELSYQNLYAVDVGYTYLIESDSNNGGLWTIYTVVVGTESLGAPRYTQLTRVQTYDTRKYWSFIDWYEVGYNTSIVPVSEVPNYSSLATVELVTPIGASVKVTSNAQNKWEIYQRTDLGWNRVGLQDGTIEFSNVLWDYAVGRFGFDVEVFDVQYFDSEPVIETRKIIQAINEELFIDDLAIYRNKALILVFNYILSEFQAPDWLTKTSLIDVNHKIRELLPFQVFRQDNQDFVLDYIQEVKPYHVQIREFNLTYNGQDMYSGEMTDFDVPAYYNRLLEIPKYVSPVLLPYTKSTAVGTGTPSGIADAYSDAEIWTRWPWSQWFNNYLLSVDSIRVNNGGSGYTEPPLVTITGDCIVQAEGVAVINNLGEVVAITITEPGEGYSTTAIVTIAEGNGSGASAYAVMGNQLVRSVKTTLKYDRCEYTSEVTDWAANTTYTAGQLVRYSNKVWSADSEITSTEFDPDNWTQIYASQLGAANRTQGYYTPTVNQPGIQLPLLIDGVEYPGVQVSGVGFNQNTGFDVGNFDITPYDNLSFGPEGRPTYDTAILDAIYESPYLDPFLGVRPTDININGGEYIDTYSSFAPEELVPGAEFDTLDMRIYTRPGADWDRNGHGFPTYSLSVAVDELPKVYSFEQWFANVPYLVTGILTNQTTGVELLMGVNFTVDWGTKEFTVTSGCNIGDVLVGTAYGVGGGNQLYRSSLVGNEITGNKINVPVLYTQIQDVYVWVNGAVYTNVTYQAKTNGTTDVTFGSTFNDTDLVVVYVFGPTTVDDTQVNYSWSAPTTQYIVADGSSLIFELDNNLGYSNPANMIVEVNGVRARTAGGAEYYADGSSAYLLPERLGFSDAVVTDDEVLVYLNEIPQVIGTDYTIEPYTGSRRHVVFNTAPASGERILIAVTTNAEAYVVNGTDLQFDPTQGLIPVAGDIIAVTTWNDTRQLDILTTVYVGPVQSGTTVTEGYDDTDFDAATVSGELGSFDYAEGITVTSNNLYLNQYTSNPDRLWVTLNGRRLFFGEEFIVVNNEIILARGAINTTDVVMITEFTSSVVPDAIAFRIFQDMRGVQATYRITPNSITTLSQTLNETDDIIYVENASNLDEPDIAANIWGVLTINGERIMYRNRDVDANTVSSLRRGTAGTAAASHESNSTVYAMARGELMPEQFQNYIDSSYFLADGSTVIFAATNITFDDTDSSIEIEAVEVWVGGTQQYTVGPNRFGDVIPCEYPYNITGASPITVEFDTAPTAGTGIDILVRRGVNWYQPGVNTPSNGVALQDTNTDAARFLRGL